MSSSESFAYANTLPNTKTFFPPDAQPYHNSAPWATAGNFALPPNLAACGANGLTAGRATRECPAERSCGVDASGQPLCCPNGTVCDTTATLGPACVPSKGF